jgi:hypothetical protein
MAAYMTEYYGSIYTCLLVVGSAGLWGFILGSKQGFVLAAPLVLKVSTGLAKPFKYINRMKHGQADNGTERSWAGVGSGSLLAGFRVVGK